VAAKAAEVVPAVPSPATTPGEVAAGRYQVQLGLFASRDNANRLAAKAVRQGVKVSVSGPDARGLYRVHTATFESREQAQAIQQKLSELGLAAAITPQH
jgi:cell division protein FtsN